jgi:hypothetical protein
MAILTVRHESFDVAAEMLSFTSALSYIYRSAPLDFAIQHLMIPIIRMEGEELFHDFRVIPGMRYRMVVYAEQRVGDRWIQMSNTRLSTFTTPNRIPDPTRPTIPPPPPPPPAAAAAPAAETAVAATASIGSTSSTSSSTTSITDTGTSTCSRRTG